MLNLGVFYNFVVLFSFFFFYYDFGLNLNCFPCLSLNTFLFFLLLQFQPISNVIPSSPPLPLCLTPSLPLPPPPPPLPVTAPALLPPFNSLLSLFLLLFPLPLLFLFLPSRLLHPIPLSTLPHPPPSSSSSSSSLSSYLCFTSPSFHLPNLIPFLALPSPPLPHTLPPFLSIRDKLSRVALSRDSFPSDCAPCSRLFMVGVLLRCGVRDGLYGVQQGW